VALGRLVAEGGMPGNYACVLGAIAGRRGAAPADAAALVLWTAANGLLAAAMRLLPVTHDETQAALARLRPLIAALAADAAGADPARIAGGAPQFEVWAMRHETASVRLFSS
jgi:urease accessory protein